MTRRPPRLPVLAAVALVASAVAVAVVVYLGVASLVGGDAADREPVTTTTPEGDGVPAWPLGTVTPQDSSDATCPAGAVCSGFEVACPDVKNAAPGILATWAPTGEAKGVVVFFAGQLPGDAWWDGGVPGAVTFLQDLARDGYEVIEVRWTEGWLEPAPGERAGPAHLACRSATAISWIHDEIYEPLGLTPATGSCGYCISGNSGGAAQAAYALSHYGLDDIVDAMVISSGPPFAALEKACTGSDPTYLFEPATARGIDQVYGFVDGDGPCSAHDPSFAGTWRRDAVDTGGSDFLYEQTRVVVIIGARDRTGVEGNIADYLSALRAAASPLVEDLTVDRMGHLIKDSADGLEALRAALVEGPA